MAKKKRELDPKFAAAVKLMKVSFDNSRAYAEEQRKLANDPEYREKRYKEMEEAERAWRRKARHLPDDKIIYD